MAATLVTGATGFIGSNVARLLVERGDEVRLGVEEGSPDAAIADLESPRVKLEVSGGVSLASVRALARLGPDRISIGRLTHSAPALDLGLDLA